MNTLLPTQYLVYAPLQCFRSLRCRIRRYHYRKVRQRRRSPFAPSSHALIVTAQVWSRLGFKDVNLSVRVSSPASRRELIGSIT